ncbi:MAG TPA: hypothetical protein VEU33_33485, partial [Archangium sp.]|nr:hypothetical protein [Archangium sp.]
WLYVVDRTTTDEPRVYPIPWTRYLDPLKYGFYANAWLDAVDRAERVASEPERATPEELSGALAGIAAETGR